MKTQYLLRLNNELKNDLALIAKDRGVSLNTLMQIELKNYVNKYKKKSSKEDRL